jgi:hypothetical protein
MTNSETTKEEFELFKSECQKWLKYFGLMDWKVDFSHEPLKDDEFAVVKSNGLEDKYAIIALNTKCDETDRKYLNIEKTAFHEVMELFLYPLYYIGTCRYAQPEEFTAANHAIIRTLENVVYPVISDKK